LARIRFIDVAKGISILLVVLMHIIIVRDIKIYNILFSFIIPFFFFISGIFIKATSNLTKFILWKSDDLLKPYFITLGFVIVFTLFVEGGNPVRMFAEILYGTNQTIHHISHNWGPLWFLPLLWLVFIFSWILVKITSFNNHPNWLRGIILLVLLVLGYYSFGVFYGVSVNILGDERIFRGLPLSSDMLILISFYFLLGFTLKDQVVKFKFKPWYFISILVVYLGINLHLDQIIVFNIRQYGHIVFSTLTILLGIYLLLSLSFILSRLPYVGSFLTYAGSMSLFILLFHLVIMNNVVDLLVVWNSSMPGINTLIAFAAAITGSMLIGTIVSRIPLLALFFLPIKNNSLFKKNNPEI